MLKNEDKNQFLRKLIFFSIPKSKCSLFILQNISSFCMTCAILYVANKENNLSMDCVSFWIVLAKDHTIEYTKFFFSLETNF